MRRRTLAEPVCLEGVAVRTHGGSVTLRLAPGEAGFGFVRDDLGRRWPADIDHVVPAPNCTALGDDQPAVLFCEHVLSALVGLGYTDVEIHLDQPEVPLLDGSATPLVEALTAAGAVDLPGVVEPYTPTRPVWLVGDGQALGVLPAERWSVDYTFEHPHPRIGIDRVTLDESTDYATAIAPARTFATAAEIDALRAAGLVRGGSEENLLVVYDDRLSAPLRLAHEYATHKALDLIGDFALFGRPLRAAIVAYRTGHSDNHELVRRLRAGLTG